MTEGYGMTETSCVISAMDEGDNLTGHVGSPSPACGELSCGNPRGLLAYKSFGIFERTPDKINFIPSETVRRITLLEA